MGTVCVAEAIPLSCILSALSAAATQWPVIKQTLRGTNSMCLVFVEQTCKGTGWAGLRMRAPA